MQLIITTVKKYFLLHQIHFYNTCQILILRLLEKILDNNNNSLLFP